LGPERERMIPLEPRRRHEVHIGPKDRTLQHLVVNAQGMR
jgi:hypothetical protein